MPTGLLFCWYAYLNFATVLFVLFRKVYKQKMH